MITEHPVSPSCGGEICRCSEPATHKIGEEIQDGSHRHNFTAYVCYRHFNEAVRSYLARGAYEVCYLPEKATFP